MAKRECAQQKYVQNPQGVQHSRFVWKEGDIVRVKSPRIAVKGQSRFSAWKEIVQLSDSAVKLDDVLLWGKRCVGLCFGLMVCTMFSCHTARYAPWNENAGEIGSRFM
ncbi:hypothetical protein NDU88_003556 [Pleurodeles waltl]|uniref:Uncharacterized protein n=1 Tax=Pleurodeles waltl TaxID=8319 RepID=A0AAV7W7B8_PLEWA|nr:hypothetical protein NDU88_003556 [Pleurodeles waltl]